MDSTRSDGRWLGGVAMPLRGRNTKCQAGGRQVARLLRACCPCSLLSRRRVHGSLQLRRMKPRRESLTDCGVGAPRCPVVRWCTGARARMDGVCYRYVGTRRCRDVKLHDTHVFPLNFMRLMPQRLCNWPSATDDRLPNNHCRAICHAQNTLPAKHRGHTVGRYQQLIHTVGRYQQLIHTVGRYQQLIHTVGRYQQLIHTVGRHQQSGKRRHVKQLHGSIAGSR